MKAKTYTILSALFATFASILFLKITETGANSVSIETLVKYLLIAMILWAPSNALMAYAMRFSTPSILFTYFGVGTAVLDTILGILILKQSPEKPLLLLIGIILGILVIAMHGNSEEESELKQNNKSMEYIIYIVTTSLVLWGYISRNIWIQLVAYCFADFLGAILIVKVMEKLKNKSQFVQDWLSGVIGFAPAMLAGLILLANLKILPIVGPATGIASAAFAIPGTYIFFRNKVNWKTASILAFVGAIAILLIYYSYF